MDQHSITIFLLWSAEMHYKIGRKERFQFLLAQ